MQKVVGSSPIIRSSESPRKPGAFGFSGGADRSGRIVYHSSSRRFELNGHLPDDLQAALVELDQP
jgi:hypothetical protein